ncbi:hypothetical protein Salmuc_01568 [Salipiger mucosus DSM 16094]|uniref:Uncharacterized protein n=1 Tax=Salipiger mucosus DSM 16094 TaxID=1123237 RepID=S9R4Q9_9RHOB|nr:hypothetical protein Salmuc_01568 [Salipiger mucosus DSM 16094]
MRPRPCVTWSQKPAAPVNRLDLCRCGLLNPALTFQGQVAPLSWTIRTRICSSRQR